MPGMGGCRTESPRLLLLREGGPGDQTWGARHDPGSASPGPVRQRHSPAGRRRPKDRQDLHRQGAGAAGHRKRPPAASLVDGFEPYLRERLAAYPALTARRLLREIEERGFSGSHSVVRDRVREIRPARIAGYERASRRRRASRPKSTSPALRSSSPMSPECEVVDLRPRKSQADLAQDCTNPYFFHPQSATLRRSDRPKGFAIVPRRRETMTLARDETAEGKVRIFPTNRGVRLAPTAWLPTTVVKTGRLCNGDASTG